MPIAEGKPPLFAASRCGTPWLFARKSSEAEFRQARQPARRELVAPISIGASEFVRPTPMALVSTPRQLAAAQPEADERDSQAALGSGVLVLDGTYCLGMSVREAQPPSSERAPRQ